MNDVSKSVEHRFYLHSSNNEVVEFNRKHTSMSFDDSSHIRWLVKDFVSVLRSLDIPEKTISLYINKENLGETR